MSLTTHVLDLSTGRPAAGLGVMLSRLDGARLEVLTTVTTNGDGRTDQPLLSAEQLSSGHYELVFSVGDYFAGSGAVESGTIPYLDTVPIRFGVAPELDHLHVALLVTPWSYTTYRGS
jgi:hydroxyisourate hydrolase